MNKLKKILNEDLIRWAILYFIVICLIFIMQCSISIVDAHETKFWKHATNNVKCYSIKNCDLDVQLWKQENGQWLPVIYAHGIIHIGQLQETDSCEELHENWQASDRSE